MIKHKSGAQKRKERFIRQRLQCKGQQRLESFGIIGRESERKRSREDAPDQETAYKEKVVQRMILKFQMKL